MKPGKFIEQYLQYDEDYDYVLKTTPCPFLNEDNTCSIYDVRPTACQEYPHTDRKKDLSIDAFNTGKYISVSCYGTNC